MSFISLGGLISLLPRSLRRHRVAKALLKFRLVDPICLCRFNRTALVWIDARDPNPRNVLLTGAYDPEFFRLASSFIGDGVFFDIGANFGLNTFGLFPLVSEKASFHLFEANPQICECLRQSATLFPKRNILVLNKAVADVRGTLSLKINFNELGQSYISPTGPVQVPAERIDDYISASGIRFVDLIKMDIEGYEPQALLGGEMNMKSGCINAIILEVKDALLSRHNSCVSDLLSQLARCGYRLFLWRADSIAESVNQGATVTTLSTRNVQFPIVEIMSNWSGADTDVLAIHERARNVSLP
jgi:FkbM family methyltransferase